MRPMLVLLTILLTLAAGPGPGAALCDVSGEWQHTTTTIGSAVWVLTPTGGGRYDAQERGLGNARGTAVVTGTVLRIEWRTAGLMGYYEWTLDAACRSGSGQLTFTSGRTGSHGSAVVRSGGRATADRETITVCDEWQVVLRDERNGDRWVGVWRKGQHFVYSANWRATDGPSQGREIRDRGVYPIAGGPMAFGSDVPGGRFVYRTSSSSFDLPSGMIEGHWYWEPGGGSTVRGGPWRARCVDFRDR